MAKVIIKTIAILLTILTLNGCHSDCIEKDPAPQPRYSLNLNESKANDVFLLEYVPDKPSFLLDSVFNFEIKDAWIENAWRHRCLNDKLQVVKDNYYQFIVDASYKGHVLTTYYYLGKRHFGSLLYYKYQNYSDRDTIKLVLYKDTSNIFKLTDHKIPIDTITFFRRQFSR